jgi:BirA family biotin operon repressor/biotin-[acetyl-CoA-carboxylase] ligase
VNQSAFRAELRDEATSLRREAGREFPRVEVLAAILSRMEAHYDRLLREGPGAILQRFGEISSYAKGKRVRVTDSSTTLGTAGPRVLTGETVGLSPEGMLLVRRDDGQTEAVLSGLVRPE